MPDRSAWRADVDLRGCPAESADKRGSSGSSQGGPAIFWPCGRGAPLTPQRQGPAGREVAELRDECRDFNEWLKLELRMQFSSLERRMDLLDSSGWLQEQLRTHLSEVDGRLSLLATQLDRCEQGITALQESALRNGTPARRRSQKVDFSFSSEKSRGEFDSGARHHHGGWASEGSTRRATPGGGWASEGSVRRAAPATQDTERLTSLASLRGSVANPFHSRNPWVERISNFLNDPESSRAASWYARTWPIFLLFSALVGLAPNFGETPWREPEMVICDVVFDVVFWLEVMLRYAICPGTLSFFMGGCNIADIFAAAPLVLRASVGFAPPSGEGTVESLLLCVVPLVRLLKTLRWTKQFFLFRQVLEDTREALVFLLLLLLIIVLLFASIIYLVEPRSNVASLPQGMWLTIVTVTTVGVAEPVTEAGHCAITALLMTSVLYMAMPIGILGNAFTQVWKDRDLILLSMRTSDRLAQWGYTARDLPLLFKIFDHEGRGELSVSEFSLMIAELRVGLSEDRTVELFDLLDKDGGGSIDGKEFIRVIFPQTYYELYGKREKKRERRPSQDSEESVSRSQTGSMSVPAILSGLSGLGNRSS